MRGKAFCRSLQFRRDGETARATDGTGLSRAASNGEEAMQDSSRNADQAPEMIDMMGGRLEVIARMGTSDTDTALFRTRVAADKLVPLHSHVDPECFYVLSGRIEVFVIDDAPGWRAVEAGRSMLVANGVRHAVRTTDQSADLFLATNGRLARYFSEADRPA
jgi:quercetin dioxygenase-like cupin family protein